MAYDVGSIHAQLRVNIAQFEQGLRQAVRETQQRSAQLKSSLDVKARLDTAPLMRGLAQAQSQAQQASAGLTRALAEGGRGATGFGAAVQRMGSFGVAAFAQMGVAFTAAGILQGLQRLITTAAAVGDQLNRLSIQTGISVEQLSSLRLAAALNDVTLDELAQSLRQMHLNVAAAARGSGEAEPVLKALGFTVDQMRRAASDPEGFLEQFAQRLARVQDAGERTEAAFRVLGRQSQNLLPLLQDIATRGLAGLRTEAERLGVLVDRETAEAMDEFNDNLTRLKLVAEALAATLGGPLIRAITDLAQAFGLLKLSPEQMRKTVIDTTLGQLKARQQEIAENLGKEGAWIDRALQGIFGGPGLEGLKARLRQEQTEIAAQITALTAERAGLEPPSEAPKGPPIKLNLADPEAEAKAAKTLQDAWRAVAAEHQGAREVLQAQGELRLAQLQAERAGEAEILSVKRDQQLAQIALEQQQLKAQEAWLKGHGKVFAEELLDVQARQQVLALEAKIVSLTTEEALQRARVTGELSAMAGMGRLQETLLQGQLERWEARGEQDAIHVRMLGLSAEREQLVLTHLQAATKARQTLVELERTRQKSAELAAEFQVKLQTTAKDQVAAVTLEYVAQQTALDQQAVRLQDILTTLGLVTQEAQRTAELAPFREAAGELVTIVHDFQSALTQGSLDIAQMVRSVGQTFVDLAMRPAFEAMQQSLAQLLQSISSQLGSWGGVISGAIGVGLVAISSLFNQQKAQVESLGDQAKAQIERTERVRGLIAGDQTIAIQQISEDLSRALRPTNSLIAQGNALLAQIAAAVGGSTPAMGAAGGGSYGISVETLGAARL